MVVAVGLVKDTVLTRRKLPMFNQCQPPVSRKMPELVVFLKSAAKLPEKREEEESGEEESGGGG